MFAKYRIYFPSIILFYIGIALFTFDYLGGKIYYLQEAAMLFIIAAILFTITANAHETTRNELRELFKLDSSGIQEIQFLPNATSYYQFFSKKEKPYEIDVFIGYSSPWARTSQILDSIAHLPAYSRARILLPSATSEELELFCISSDFIDNVKFTARLMDDFSAKESDNIEIRRYKFYPSISFLIIDKSLMGFVEPFPNKESSSLLFATSATTDVSKNYSSLFDRIWQNSTDEKLPHTLD